MAFSNAQLYPYTATPLTNISPFSYRDGSTYLEIQEQFRQWINEYLVPSFNAGIDNAIQEFDNAFQYVNNKTGQAEIQRLTLTAPYTLAIDPLWPNNMPINIVLTQNIVGGHAVTFSPDIVGTVPVKLMPGESTDFWLFPRGDGKWVPVIFVTGEQLAAEVAALTATLGTKANASSLATTNANVANLTGTVNTLTDTVGTKADTTDMNTALGKKASVVTTFAELKAAVTAGGLVRVADTPITITERLYVTQPTKVQGGHFVLPTSAGYPVFQITSSDVTIDGSRFVGSGTSQAYEVGTRFVWASGTVDNYLTNVNVINCNMDGCQSENIRFTCVRDSVIERNYIDDFLYAGVMLMSCEDMVVSSNRITNAVMKAPVVNVYGIAATDSTNNETNRSRRVTITSNIIRNIPWEGIDTHGGEGIVINDNIVTGCSRGIALVAGNDTRTIVPVDCVVSGNIVTLGGATDTTREGIGLHGNTALRAGATITGNKVGGGYQLDRRVFLYNVANTSTLVEGNSAPHQAWTPITMTNPDYWIANSAEPPEWMVDGRETVFRGIITPGPTQAIGNTLIGTIGLAGRPARLTIARPLRGGNQNAVGQGSLAIYPSGEVWFLYRNNTTDGYNYSIDTNFQRNYTG